MSKTLEELGFKKTDGKDIDLLSLNPFKMIGKDWMLVTAGNENSWNTMTASWGFTGVMWGKNVAETVIRPQRYTKEFIDSSEYFTLSFFDESQRDILKYCGTHSGRDVNKAEQTGLAAAKAGESIAFEQAKTVILCRKMFVQPMLSESFTDKKALEQWYPDNDFHVQYIGEIVAVYTK
ncbi:MAG: flavin reductase [Oscillospiraceae bacterium]